MHLLDESQKPNILWVCVGTFLTNEDERFTFCLNDCHCFLNIIVPTQVHLRVLSDFAFVYWWAGHDTSYFCHEQWVAIREPETDSALVEIWYIRQIAGVNFRLRSDIGRTVIFNFIYLTRGSWKRFFTWSTIRYLGVFVAGFLNLSEIQTFLSEKLIFNLL